VKRAAFALLLLGAAPPRGAPLKLPPVDQCSRDPSFKAFHATLKQAVAKRDGAALLKLVAPDVLVSFGGENGRASLAKQWEINSAKSELWREFDNILPLGCARVGSARVIPSLAGQFESNDDSDVFELAVVVKAGAQLRKGPAKDSKVLATLAWDVVRPLSNEGETQTKVRLKDGREGWLWAKDVRAPIDYRATIEKRKGKWMITAFVAGD
jgi:hypothetical protein